MAAWSTGKSGAAADRPFGLNENPGREPGGGELLIHGLAQLVDPRGPATAPLAVACAPLAGPRTEAWLAGAIGESAETRGAAWAHGEHYALVAVVVQEEQGDIEAATRAAERARTALSKPFSLGGLLVEVGASAGIAVAPDHGDELDVLLQRADVAMNL